jgi:hypothetical protein
VLLWGKPPSLISLARSLSTCLGPYVYAFLSIHVWIYLYIHLYVYLTVYISPCIYLCTSILSLCLSVTNHNRDMFVELVGFVREEENARLCAGIIDLVRQHADPREFTAVSERNQILVDALWQELISREASYNPSYQHALLALYSHLWGSGTPPCVAARAIEEKYEYETGGRVLLLLMHSTCVCVSV